MGIDPIGLPESFKSCLDPEARKELGLESSTERTSASSVEPHQRLERKLERDEQNTFAAWLSLREADGVLVYDWSRTDRKTTNRKGIPDFRIYAQGIALLAEMKIGAGKFSPDQVEMIKKFQRSGTTVVLWHSAAEAIETTRNWLALITYGKTSER